ncbi:MAG: STAS domain-containing protein [Patescibacteria group bacterium]
MTDYMRHSLEARGDVLVIKLEGSFCNDAPDYFRGVENREPMLQSWKFRQFKRVVFDLSKVEVMTSSGIGILITIQRMARKAGYSEPVVIARANKRVRNVLVVTQIASMFELCNSMDQALGVRQP